jgi:hypothetical protein
MNERMKWMWIFAAVMACGGDGEAGTTGTGTGATGGGSTGGGSGDEGTLATGGGTTTSPMDGSDDAAGSSGSDGDETAAGSTGSGTTGESTGGAALECEDPPFLSTCANPNSIVRGVAVLGNDDGPTTGTLRIQLNHEYLGGGAMGGVPHTGTSIPGVDFAAGPVPFAVDMCTNGEMWSEENCGFVVHVILDVDADGTLDPGEPSGSVPVFLSCTGDPVCTEVALDCTDGSTCLAFPDPTYCGCPAVAASCDSPIVAC